MPVDVNTQIRQLPFHMISKLDLYLEPPGSKSWEALISVMPEGRYSANEVELLKVRGRNGSNSCTRLLLQDLGHRCVTVKELVHYLKKIQNYDALSALDWPYEPAVITTQPEAVICQEGQQFCLRVDATGYPPPTYQWSKDDKEIPDEVVCELRRNNVTAAANGIYKCVVSNEENSVSSNEVKVRVMRKGPPVKPKDPEPGSKPVIKVHPSSNLVLPGSNHELRCVADGAQPLRHQWYKNGEEIPNANYSTLKIYEFCEQNTGAYACRVSNSHGDDISDDAELTMDRVRNIATDKVALLIGNQDYTANFPLGYQGHGGLQHTIADTQTLGSLLHRDDMGFNVLSFANLSLDEMKKAVHEYINLLSEGCYTVFYFAGHGFEINGKHYLVPVDAPADWTQADAICIQWILESIWKSRPQLTVILLDMCRVKPENSGKPIFEEYDFPHDLNIVMGFATCSQSESYERVEEKNGIYMKYLKNHICRDVKIQDILHAVTTEVEEECKNCRYTDRQRPEYHSRAGGYYSLRDPVRPHGNTSAERWLEAHKLPERRIIEFEGGVRVDIRFEHCNWLSNTINILVGVVDKGNADQCFAYISQLPNGLEGHFNQVVDIEGYYPQGYGANGTDDEVVPRSRPQQFTPAQATPSLQRSTEMFHLQRLGGNLSVTISVECVCSGQKTRKHKVLVFPAREFGLANVFHT